jgi:hypothetical protein
MQRQFAAIAPAPFDTRQSIVGPPKLAIMVFSISDTFAEGGVLIALMGLSFD